MINAGFAGSGHEDLMPVKPVFFVLWDKMNVDKIVKYDRI